MFCNTLIFKQLYNISYNMLYNTFNMLYTTFVIWHGFGYMLYNISVIYAALFCKVTKMVRNIKCMLYNSSQPSRCTCSASASLSLRAWACQRLRLSRRRGPSGAGYHWDWTWTWNAAGVTLGRFSNPDLSPSSTALNRSCLWSLRS